jgi:alpha-galactosidase
MLRAMTALFGHMGIEADVRDFSEADRTRLIEAIALHKRHRALLHGGLTQRLDLADPGALAMMVSSEQGALVSYAQVETSPHAAPEPLRLPGLEPETAYRITLLKPSKRAGAAMKRLPDLIAGKTITATGRMLAVMGLPLPVLRAGEIAVFHLDPIA